MFEAYCGLGSWWSVVSEVHIFTERGEESWQRFLIRKLIFCFALFGIHLAQILRLIFFIVNYKVALLRKVG